VDGTDEFATLPSTIDEDKGTIQVNLPVESFSRQDDGSYLSSFKIGMVKVLPSTRAVSMAITPRAGAAAAVKYPANLPQNLSDYNELKLQCPLTAGCQESSRFNMSRILNHKPMPHPGVDFATVNDTPVFVEAGGQVNPVSYGQTEFAIKYSDCLSNGKPIHFLKTDNSTLALKCENAARGTGLGSGMWVQIDYPTQNYAIRFLHLDSISQCASASSTQYCALDVNGKVKFNNPTTATDPVAYSGGSGLGANAPHLHYELYTSNVPICPKKKSCSYAPGNTDVFPYIASTIKLKEQSGQTTISKGTAYTFLVSATDYKGVPVWSNVKSAGEGSPAGTPPSPLSGINYGPTRKICIITSAANGLPLPPVAPNSASRPTFSGDQSSLCAPWGSNIDQNGGATSYGDPKTTAFTLRAIGGSPTSVNAGFGYFNVPSVPISSEPIKWSEDPISLSGGTGTYAYTYTSAPLQDPFLGLPGNVDNLIPQFICLVTINNISPNYTGTARIKSLNCSASPFKVSIIYTDSNSPFITLENGVVKAWNICAFQDETDVSGYYDGLYHRLELGFRQGFESAPCPFAATPNTDVDSISGQILSKLTSNGTVATYSGQATTGGTWSGPTPVSAPN
jgi:murein DD-endopeptidase MepM/ murein hydrolase activator NlpD